jgi:hypothetical protein
VREGHGRLVPRVAAAIVSVAMGRTVATKVQEIRCQNSQVRIPRGEWAYC